MSKSQTPSYKEIPNSKFQIPNKIQAPNPKKSLWLHWEFRPWNLFAVWDLGFGIFLEVGSPRLSRAVLGFAWGKLTHRQPAFAIQLESFKQPAGLLGRKKHFLS